MLIDTKLAALVKPKTTIVGLKEDNIYYFVFDGAFAIKVTSLTEYPKFMAKLYATGVLTPDGELCKCSESCCKFFQVDVRAFQPAEYTYIDIAQGPYANIPNTLSIWSVRRPNTEFTETDSVAVQKRYTEAITELRAFSPYSDHAASRMLYFVGNENDIQAIVMPVRFEFDDYLNNRLPAFRKTKGAKDNG